MLTFPLQQVTARTRSLLAVLRTDLTVLFLFPTSELQTPLIAPPPKGIISTGLRTWKHMLWLERSKKGQGAEKGEKVSA